MIPQFFGLAPHLQELDYTLEVYLPMGQQLQCGEPPRSPGFWAQLKMPIARAAMSIKTSALFALVLVACLGHVDWVPREIMKLHYSGLAGMSLAAAAHGFECSNSTVQRLGLPKGIQYSATKFAAGGYEVANTSYTDAAYNNASFCQITGALPYGPNGNNTLSFELWLPEKSAYNNRYVSVGNGGFAGSIDYFSMLTQLNAGYAVGGGNGGHPASENGETKPGSYVAFFHDRSKVLTWIRNSIAMFSKPAIEIVKEYYGKPPTKKYYVGCSTGGAQGFALAQYHPEIFDGISAGCPGNWYSHLILSFLWNGFNSLNDSYLPQDALDLITEAALDKCDSIDGTLDRVISDPAKCSFNVTELLCKANQAPVSDNKTNCLTELQLQNAEKFYAGPKDSRTGKAVYPGFAPGSESAWMNQQESLYLEYGTPILQNLVFNNLSYDSDTFNWGSDVDAVDEIASPFIDHISPDLEAFRKSGGKMIVTQGWVDPYNAPYWPIEHREQLREVSGDALDSFFSLFMIPGGGHCGGSAPYPHVPATYDTLDRLVSWVEEEEVPQNLVGTEPADGSDVTTTLLPYPRETAS